MKYPRILSAIRSAKWAVTETTLQAIRDTLSARLTGRIGATARAELDLGSGVGDEEQTPPYEMAGAGVASVKLHGIIGKNLSGMETSCGGCDIAAVEQNLIAALADPGVGAVILDIDSPGGTVGGVAEFALKIASLRAESGKDVIAYASGQCCSAAYWIACGCSDIACSPSSDVGSIGVYMAMVDESENWAEEGYKLVLIKAGEHKGAGMGGSKITPEQIALWQADVDFIYAQFTAAVRASRFGIEDATMQGQTFYGPRAVTARLASEIFPDVEALADAFAPKFTSNPQPVDTSRKD